MELCDLAADRRGTDRVPEQALGEAAVQEVDVGPDPRLDPPARVDELERKVRSAAACPQPFLLRDRVHALDDPVVLELRDRRHAPSLGPETDATVRRLWPRSSR